MKVHLESQEFYCTTAILVFVKIEVPKLFQEKLVVMNIIDNDIEHRLERYH